MKKTSYFSIFTTFFTLGLMTFGGGLSMLPFIKKQALQKQWIVESDWEKFLAIIQLIPGAIAINMSHLIGYRIRGILGGLVAVLGMVLPSFLVITLFAYLLYPWLEAPWFQSIMNGVYLVVIAFLIKALIDFLRRGYSHLVSWIYGGLASVLLVLSWVNPAWLILAALVLGWVDYLLGKKR